ncbi:MAG TPA: hypothetical protein ENI42_01380, partial [Thermoplasmatales archaeon]|nr:hypothetical protein [Thermoplasmatales archaeon]
NKDVPQPGKTLKELATIFSVPVNKLGHTVDKFLKDLPKTGKISAKDPKDACQRLFNMWKKANKKKKKIPVDLLDSLKRKAQRIDSITLITVDNPETIKALDAVAVAGAAVKNNKTVICVNDGKGIVMAASEDISIDLRPIAQKVGRILEGGGGGKQRMVRCGGPKLEKLNEAFEEAKKLILSNLQEQQI